ncbi:hypothetical protein L914_09174 [Phytophthora nicotianae]|uniref:Uncharacterized protein n=1 Tax=Phytophthora nicotianae TaxID=4792 RepID=W2NBE9_PHYNI|nr:hypothetical protein L914_09174 [Phytophthora nicotianae]
MKTCYNERVGRRRGSPLRQPLTTIKTTMTCSQRLKEASTFVGGLQKLGSCALRRLWRVATLELATRIEDAKPKLIISASCGVEPKDIIDYGPLLNGAIERSSWNPNKAVMTQCDLCPFPMTKGRDATGEM